MTSKKDETSFFDDQFRLSLGWLDDLSTLCILIFSIFVFAFSVKVALL